MILKEFDLDLPFCRNENYINSLIKAGKTREVATKMDYNENWKEKRLLLRKESRCMTAMFERLFPRYKTRDCWKLLIELVEINPDPKIYTAGGIFTIQVQHPFTTFIGSSDYQKKKMTVELLFKGIQVICCEKNWEISIFRNTMDLIIQADYVNEWAWKKPIKSPNRELTAQVICRHEVKKMDIYLAVKRTDTLLFEKLIVTTEPHEFAFMDILGELKWDSNEKIRLISKSHDRNFYLDLFEDIN